MCSLIVLHNHMKWHQRQHRWNIPSSLPLPEASKCHHRTRWTAKLCVWERYHGVRARACVHACQIKTVAVDILPTGAVPHCPVCCPVSCQECCKVCYHCPACCHVISELLRPYSHLDHWLPWTTWTEQPLRPSGWCPLWLRSSCVPLKINDKKPT